MPDRTHHVLDQLPQHHTALCERMRPAEWPAATLEGTEAAQRDYVP